ncbi:hypothetical protein GWO72_08135 [Corynebacterium macginleyi]|nr:hypothetical protein [Corynebacterium macginleyi]
MYVWGGESLPAEGLGVEFRGPQGPEGPQGPAGQAGSQGPQGADGSAGPQGAPGKKGDAGEPGPRGTRWFFGAGVPTTVSDSIAGDTYLDTSTGTIYQLGLATMKWEKVGQLPAGPAGPPGPAGPKGEPGTGAAHDSAPIKIVSALPKMRLPSFSGHPISTDLVSVGEDVHCEFVKEEVHPGVPA